jgi:hypothetical protein
MKKWFGLLCLVPLLSGCSHLQTRLAPSARLADYHNVFVEHELSDGRSVDLFIQRKLQAMGFVAAAGPLTMKPTEAELVLSYQEHWTFDFTTYIIEIDMQVHDARTGRELAVGHYFHPSITNEYTSEVVDPLIEQLFGPNGAKPVTR